MIWPPSILRIRVVGEEKKGVNLWIPLFLLWPLIFVAAMLFPVVARLSSKVREETGFVPSLAAGPYLWTAFAATRGMRVEVRADDAHVFVGFL